MDIDGVVLIRLPCVVSVLLNQSGKMQQENTQVVWRTHDGVIVHVGHYFVPGPELEGLPLTITGLF